MSAGVTVIDYGVGNLLSVTRALEHCGAVPTLTGDPRVVEQAERLVLPGVGAFQVAISGLQSYGLVEPIRRFAASGRPLLAICLGMQMLATTSDEFGKHEGLGVLPGRVVQLPSTDLEGNPQKIPSIGWAELAEPVPGRWAASSFGSVLSRSQFYLLHSFHFTADDKSHHLADYFYGGHRITAAVQAGNIVGCQFHPEKSGQAGLQLLRTFMQQSRDQKE